MEEEDKQHDYNEEYLNSIEASGIPQHTIRLKIGTPIIAVRNITEGVCNGTRMVVTGMNERSIKARVLTGAKSGEEVVITKITLSSDQDASSETSSLCVWPLL